VLQKCTACANIAPEKLLKLHYWSPEKPANLVVFFWSWKVVENIAEMSVMYELCLGDLGRAGIETPSVNNCALVATLCTDVEPAVSYLVLSSEGSLDWLHTLT